MDDAGLVGVFQLFEDLVEDEGGLVAVELQLTDNYGLFVRENGQGVILLLIVFTFEVPAIFGPTDRVVQLFHYVVFPLELLWPFFEKPLDHFAKS